MIELEKLSTGTPSLDRILKGGLPRNSINVQHLSPQVRYVVETRRSIGDTKLALLAEHTGLPVATLESILQDLKQQGLVIQFSEAETPHYRAAG